MSATYEEEVEWHLRNNPTWDRWMAEQAADETFSGRVRSRDIEETTLHLNARKHAQAIVDQAPGLLAMIEGKIYEIDHPWRCRFRKVWAAVRRLGKPR